jgi:hypothetical protein
VVDTDTGEIIEAETEPAATKAQLGAIAAMLSKLGYRERDARHAEASKLIGRDIADGTDITKAEAHALIEKLKPMCDAAPEAEEDTK